MRHSEKPLCHDFCRDTVGFGPGSLVLLFQANPKRKLSIALTVMGAGGSRAL